MSYNEDTFDFDFDLDVDIDLAASRDCDPSVEGDLSAFQRLSLLLAWITAHEHSELSHELENLIRLSGRLDELDDAGADHVVERTHEILELILAENTAAFEGPVSSVAGRLEHGPASMLDVSSVRERLQLWSVLAYIIDRDRVPTPVSPRYIHESLAMIVEQSEQAAAGGEAVDCVHNLLCALEQMFLHHAYWATGGSRFAGTAFGKPYTDHLT